MTRGPETSPPLLPEDEDFVQKYRYLSKEVVYGDPPDDVAPDEALIRPVTKPYQFQVTLDRDSTSELIGMSYDKTAGTHLTVLVVRPGGLCAKWNWEMRQFPPESELVQHQIAVNDEIVRVNHASTALEMAEQLKTQLVVAILVRRRPRVTAAAPVPAATGMAAPGHVVPPGQAAPPLGPPQGCGAAPQGYVGSAQVQQASTPQRVAQVVPSQQPLPPGPVGVWPPFGHQLQEPAGEQVPTPSWAAFGNTPLFGAPAPGFSTTPAHFAAPPTLAAFSPSVPPAPSHYPGQYLGQSAPPAQAPSYAQAPTYAQAPFYTAPDHAPSYVAASDYAASYVSAAGQAPSYASTSETLSSQAPNFMAPWGR